MDMFTVVCGNPDCREEFNVWLDDREMVFTLPTDGANVDCPKCGWCHDIDPKVAELVIQKRKEVGYPTTVE